jgi:diguanylate cyclase (GGDEF)-like protein
MSEMLGGVTGLPARIRGAGPLLRLAGMLAVAGAGWFAVNVVRPVGPPVLLWSVAPVAAVVVVAIYRRTARCTALPEPTRRFWRHLASVVALVGAGSLAQAVDVVLNPGPGNHTPPPMLLSNGTAVLIIVYALYRLPFGRQSVGDLFRMFLDAGTVMLATAVFTWHLHTRELLETGAGSGPLAVSLVMTAMALVAVFALGKVLFSGYTFIDAKGLRLLGLAMLLGALGPVLQPLLPDDGRLHTMQVAMPVVFFLAAWAAEQQQVAVPAPRRGTPAPPRRALSVLPYLAVAAVDGLLAYVSWVQHDDQPVVVGAAIAVTALVALRQSTALRDNARLLARLDHGANHDGLTGLPNRVHFHTRLAHVLTAAEPRPVAVALIDLDDFKEVNDTLGHEVGDQLLIAVAERLDGSVRAQDTVARLGGDEFVVVLDGTDPAAADLATGRMMAALSRPVQVEEHELPIRASIGIADGRTGDEASVLLRRADIAMYAAKKLPGTASLHYDDSMATVATDHAHLGAELRQALESDQLFLVYQPVVSLDDGRVRGAEALVRWAHPARGTLVPDAFVPQAERTGLIVPLGRWVLRTALRQMAAWQAEFGTEAPGVLNVNVSARDLREPGFADEVKALLDAHGLRPDQVTLEITETMALEPGTSVANLHRLRAHGVRVSLDDFGTGHSTLTLLHDCPIDEIKLDRAFTQAQVDGRVPVAAAVIHLAQALGLHAVAEGVETAEQAELLLSLGYVAAQGYWFAPPMPAAEFGVLLARGGSLAPQPVEWQMSA